MQTILPIGQIEFMTTSKQRCIDTGEEYYSAFIGQHNYTFTDRDDILRSTKNCFKYQKFVLNKKCASIEEKLFARSHFDFIKKKLFNLWVYPVIFKFLMVIKIMAIFGVAGTEIAEYGSLMLSKFLFKEDLNKLSYYFEIERFWLFGNAYKINYESCCLLLSDYFKRMEQVIKMHKQGRSHSLLTVRSTNERYFDGDNEITAENWNILKNDRKFNISEFLPFNSNVIIFLYYKDTYRLKLLINQKSIKWPNLNDDRFITIKNHFAVKYGICNISDVCDL
ncbi:hypothetical protein A3Q56_00395 [Intoshia linei]|uniref:Uncharacterized protein n=1 Tax=Intoshia linei TaxID=1819745 RepID=A0A177BCC2_9BILA|nr:hypothetical protein A3Q56_00395 [Intoshia linei]